MKVEVCLLCGRVWYEGESGCVGGCGVSEKSVGALVSQEELRGTRAQGPVS